VYIYAQDSLLESTHLPLGTFFALDNTDFQTLEFEGCVFPPFLLLS